MCIDALLETKHKGDRQTYLACYFLDIICSLECTKKELKDEFENAKASIVEKLSKHGSTSQNVNETEHRKNFYNIMLKIIGWKDIPTQIEAFTIALIAGNIGRDNPPDYTIKVAERILQSSGIRDVISLADDDKVLQVNSEKVVIFANFIKNPLQEKKRKIIMENIPPTKRIMQIPNKNQIN